MSETGEGCADVRWSSRSEPRLFRAERRKQKIQCLTVKVAASVSKHRTLRETLVQAELRTSEQLRLPAGSRTAAAAIRDGTNSPGTPPHPDRL